jgi:cytochrome c2
MFERSSHGRPPTSMTQNGASKSWFDLLGVLVVLQLPGLVWLEAPLWRLETGLVVQMVLMAAAHVALVASFESLRPQSLRSALLYGVVAAAVVAVAVVPFAVSSGAKFSRPLAIIAGLVSASLIVLRVTRSRVFRTSLGLLVIASLYLVAHALADVTPAPDARAGEDGAATPVQQIFTAQYPLELRSTRITQERTTRLGGGIAALDGRYMAVTADGAFFLMSEDPSSGEISWNKLAIPSPLRRDLFARGVSTHVTTEWFRVQDLAVRPVVDGLRLVVSHHVWDQDHHCFALALSALTLDSNLAPRGAGWDERVRTKPCLALGFGERGIPFAGLEDGGRLAWTSGETLLMTTGDHQFDGVNRSLAAAQEPDNDYGKTLQVDLSNGSVRRFSLGHRNPQGLHVDDGNYVWLTEHGPQGGDELNLLTDGGNYGWPLETFGTDYGRDSWPGSSFAPPGFRQPVHAWVPSVGISNLIRIRGTAFSKWRGDLLIGSLRARTVFRVRLNDAREVAFVEPILVQRRVRDIEESPDGTIWLWTDEGEVVTIRPAAERARADAGLAACAGCHIIDPDLRSGGLGPNLYGVVGRAVASNQSFGSYSAALKRVGGTWTVERLDAFLAAPAAFAPGTTMTYRVPSAGERAAIISLLQARSR